MRHVLRWENRGSPSRAMAVDQNTEYEPLARGVSQACPQPCARAPGHIWRRRQQAGGSRQQKGVLGRWGGRGRSSHMMIQSTPGPWRAEVERGQGLACALRLLLLYGTEELDSGGGGGWGVTQRGISQAVEDTQELKCKLVVVHFSGPGSWVWCN